MDKLCIHCNWCSLNLNKYCRRPDLLSKVDGTADEYCFIERGVSGKCGPAGKYWEPIPKPIRKTSWWKRFFENT